MFGELFLPDTCSLSFEEIEINADIVLVKVVSGLLVK